MSTDEFIHRAKLLALHTEHASLSKRITAAKRRHAKHSHLELRRQAVTTAILAMGA